MTGTTKRKRAAETEPQSQESYSKKRTVSPTAGDANDCDAASLQSEHDFITARNQNQSPLLRLPGELRNRIYNYVFNDHSTIILGGCGHPPFIVGLTPSPYEYRHQLPWPALRHVCRVTHAETKLLCYSLTTFRSEQIGKLCVWYNGLAREQQESVRRVQMRCYRSKTIVGRLERIRDLPNNQIEEVVVRSATIWDARSAEDKEAAKKFADEQGWRIGFTQ